MGLTEDLETTIQAFETLVPRFFSGGSAIYDEINSESLSRTKTEKRTEPKQKTLKFLRGKLKREYELYDYVKDLFYKKVQHLKDSGLWVSSQ